MHIIPAIDIIDGKAVRLTQGDYRQKTEYNARPLEVAQQFEDAGLTRLHLDYVRPFSAMLHRDNFYAAQFHAEISGNVGQRILENFLKL